MITLKKRLISVRILLLTLFLVISCTRISIPSQAAISTQNIKTAKGGTFIQTDTGKWTFRQKNGQMAKDKLLNIKGKTYCFNKKGIRISGWKTIDGNKYYFGTSKQGYMYKGTFLKQKNGTTYYLRQDGKLAKGWCYYKSKRYYFDKETGALQYGWLKLKKKQYYLGTTGYVHKNTFITYEDHIYYLLNDGQKATGWQLINGYKYYFNKKGQAYTGTRKIDGLTHCFDKNGKLLYSGPKLTISSTCALLMDAATGEILYEKNGEMKHANASTTKIMTCILALEKAKLTDTVKISSYAASTEPSKLYMAAGDSFKLKDLLYSLMLPSHNDTAVAIAEHVSGSTEKFVALMNEKAKKLGCTNTCFATPNGLDADYTHYTTARDMALITKHALKKSTLRTIVNTSSYSFSSLSGRSYYVSSTNQLLNSLSYVTGMKTGYTNKAGYCFIGTMKGKNGHTYISVTFGADTDTDRWKDAKTLLEYAYKKS